MKGKGLTTRKRSTILYLKRENYLPRIFYRIWDLYPFYYPYLFKKKPFGKDTDTVSRKETKSLSSFRIPPLVSQRTTENIFLKGCIRIFTETGKILYPYLFKRLLILFFYSIRIFTETGKILYPYLFKRLLILFFYSIRIFTETGKIRIQPFRDTIFLRDRIRIFPVSVKIRIRSLKKILPLYFEGRLPVTTLKRGVILFRILPVSLPTR